MKLTVYFEKNRVFPNRTEITCEMCELGADDARKKHMVESIEEYSESSAIVKAGAFDIEIPEETIKEIQDYFKGYPAFDEKGGMIFYNKENISVDKVI